MSVESSVCVEEEGQDSLTERYAAFLSEELGFAPDRVNRWVLDHLTKSVSLDELSSKETESAIIAAATVGETYFLRHHSHFDWITDAWLSLELDKRRANLAGVQPLRILSAGCASGEEAYSLAAVVSRELASRGVDVPVEVIGFDINDEFLQRAEGATYGFWSLRGVDLEREAGWLSVDGGQVSVRDDVAGSVRFVRHNILEPLHTNSELSGRFDLILCRNVLIYFHSRAIQKAYTNLERALRPGGALLVGPSDPRPDDSQGLWRSWESEVRVYRSGARAPSRNKPTVKRARGAGDEAGRATGRAKTPLRDSKRTSTRPTSVNVCDLARRLSRLSQPRLALDLLKRHLAQQPLDIDAHVLGALHAAEHGHLDQAFSWARRGVFLAPKAPYAVFVLGDICCRMEKFATARRYFRWAGELLEGRRPGELLRYSDGCTVYQLQEVLRATRIDRH